MQIWWLMCGEIDDILVLIYAVSYDMYTTRTVRSHWLDEKIYSYPTNVIQQYVLYTYHTKQHISVPIYH
jgi:hypothetical protein